MNYQAIAEAIRQAGEESGEFETMNYSGRGMYGVYCLAISGNPWSVAVTLTKWAKDRNNAELLQFLQGYSPQEDALGYDTVIYWQRLPALETNQDEKREDWE